MSAPPSFDPPTEDALREFFEQSINLVCVAGTDGYFKYVNPVWEKTFGYSRNELVSRPYLEFVHPEDREGTIDQAAHVASGRNIVSFENRYRCKGNLGSRPEARIVEVRGDMGDVLRSG